MTQELRNLAAGLFALVRDRALSGDHYRAPRKLQELFGDLAAAEGRALLGGDIVRAAYVLEDEGLADVITHHPGETVTIALTPKGRDTTPGQARRSLLPEHALLN